MCSGSMGARLLLTIFIVGTGEQMPEDQLRNVHTLLLVHLYRHTCAIVPHLDLSCLLHVR